MQEGWWQAADGNWYPPEQHPDPNYRLHYSQTSTPHVPSWVQPGDTSPAWSYKVPERHIPPAATPSPLQSRTMTPGTLTALVVMLVLVVGGLIASFTVWGNGSDSPDFAAVNQVDSTPPPGALIPPEAPDVPVDNPPLTAPPLEARGGRSPANIQPHGESLTPPPQVAGDEPLGAVEPPPFARGNGNSAPSTVEPGNMRGEIVLVVAHWCPHSDRMLRELKAWIDAGNAPAAIRFQVVSTGIDPTYSPGPEKWLAEIGWSGNVIHDHNNQMAAEMKITSFPTVLFNKADRATAIARSEGWLDIDAFEKDLMWAFDG